MSLLLEEVKHCDERVRRRSHLFAYGPKFELKFMLLQSFNHPILQETRKSTKIVGAFMRIHGDEEQSPQSLGGLAESTFDAQLRFVPQMVGSSRKFPE